MNKKFLLLLIVGVLFISSSLVVKNSFGQTSDTTSSTTGGVFGGKIANTKAERIVELEGSGYYCNYSGTTIEVTPIRTTMPYSYAIPAGIKNKTGFSLRDGQWILGKYKGKTTVTCPNENPEIPPEYVILDEISIYGTSKI
jgi:hypothetical protein